MRIDTDAKYLSLLSHNNIFLEKHGFFKFDEKLYTYIAFGPYKKKKVLIVQPSKINTYLSLLYSTPAFRKNGRDSFFNTVREFYGNITREQVFNFLKQQENYQLHVIQPREKTVKLSNEKKINTKWQIDLIDMSNYPKSGYKWILTVIDCFSKYAWALPLKNKESFTVRENLEIILNKGHDLTKNYPATIQSDNGKEFVNKDFEFLFDVFNIKHIFIPAYNPQSNGMIERFNRTLKNSIFQTDVKNWVNNLEILINKYNNSIHSSIKDKPINIHKLNRVSIKQQKMVDDKINNQKSFKYPLLKIGDKVRVHVSTDKDYRKNQLFTKKYLPRWSKEIYTVKYITSGIKDTYQLKNEKEVIDKTFYRRDLLQI